MASLRLCADRRCIAEWVAVVPLLMSQIAGWCSDNIFSGGQVAVAANVTAQAASNTAIVFKGIGDRISTSLGQVIASALT